MLNFLLSKQPTYYKNKVVSGLAPIWNAVAALAVLLSLILLSGGTAWAADLNDIGGHWAAAEIEKAVSSGYVQGYPDGTFRPDSTVNRVEFVAMLDRAFQTPTGNYDTPGDVSDQDWFAQAVKSALAAGFVSDYQDGTFRPQEAVSRQDGACMLAKLLKLDGATTSSFSDQDEIGDWAKTSVSGLVAAGIMAGYPDGSFRPQEVITRAEAVVMINKALALRSLTPVTDRLQATGEANSNDGSSASGGSPTNGGVSFYGIDLAAYPGDDAMQAWWNDSPFYYTGFYLGPAPYHPDDSFMDKRQVLVDQGWGLLPIYLGRQADSWNLDKGKEDGDDAANLAASAGFPRHTVVFLDVETWLPLSDSFLSYVTDWASEVESQGYTAGVYCYIDNASQLRDALPANVEFWVAHYTGKDLPSSMPSPADSGASFASAWQFVGDTCLTYGGFALDVDFNTSTYTDPATELVTVKK